MASPLPLTDPERVRALVRSDDRVRRNLQITQSYHELSTALDAYLGDRDVSWCCFATYASKQAGRFIRNEEVPAPLRRFFRPLAREPWRWLTLRGWLHASKFFTYARMTVDDISHSVGEGNRLVYAKLAPLFADFLVFLAAHPEPDDEGWAAFITSLEADPSNDEKLSAAFTALYTAAFEHDPQQRAEHVYLANILIGWHEQIRLQEAIDGALRAPIRRALADPARRYTKVPLPLALRQAIAAGFRLLFGPWIRKLEDDWLRVATSCFMSLGSPSEELRLGDDLPPLPDGEMYPLPLRDPTLPTTLETLATLDYTPHTLRGSGAGDWTLLEDRMNYVVDYFRSRQQSRSLLQAPYTAAQVAAIHRGELAIGPL